jgi:hypothetical protein
VGEIGSGVDPEIGREAALVARASPVAAMSFLVSQGRNCDRLGEPAVRPPERPDEDEAAPHIEGSKASRNF